jgi:TolB-like protein
MEKHSPNVDSPCLRAPCENLAMLPTRDEIAAELDRVLTSDTFAATARLSRFLRYVVERALAGESDRLKEYVIGIEVFDRDEHYDPRVDSIVRVEAGRLRMKLEEYYRGVGLTDRIVIRLEKGRYAPHFVRRADGSPASTAAVARTTGSSDDWVGAAAAPGATRFHGRAVPRRRAAFAAAIAVMAGLAAAVYWRMTDRTDAVGANVVVAVLPFATDREDAADATLAMRLTERVTAELVRLDRFSVVASTVAREAVEARGSLNDVARTLRADFLLEASVSNENGLVRIDARLIDGARGRKVWVETITGDKGDTDDVARRVAAGAAAASLKALP